MKNLTYILFVVFTLTLMSFSCQKEDPITPEETGITANDLVGNWDFQLLEMPDGTSYTNCSQTPSGNWELYIFDISEVTTTNTCILLHLCYDFPKNSTFTIDNENKTIKISFGMTGFLQFKIENYDTFNGTVLKLKLLESLSTELPFNGAYTFQKQ